MCFAPILSSIMLRRFLVAILLLLVTLAVVARLRDLLRAPMTVAVAPRDSSPPDLTLSRQAGDHRGRSAIENRTPPVLLDSTARLTIRQQLGAEPERHYLDSLLLSSDSIIRHWPTERDAVPYALVPGGPPGFLPGMVHEVRDAIDAWQSAGVGLRLIETSDTTQALLIVHWADTLGAERGGFTDVTWDRGGRIRKADIYLATRASSTGRPLLPGTRRAIALHELGHALGLPHSNHSDDAMFPVAEASAPSDRDRFSLRLLYRLPTGWVGTGSQVLTPR